jgi:glucose/arabinose dehydrogenase
MGNYMYPTEEKFLQLIQLLDLLKIKNIIVGLPSTGDHYNNQIAFGSDGRLYFGQGTATNSGVVGEDNAAFGWLQLAPKFHDIPGKDITLAGQNFNSSNPLTMDPKQNKSTTGAFSPFGNSTTKGQIIKGDVKCNGCIISANPDGTGLKVVGWGLRNPFGLAFERDGKHLVVSMNGADERGSRPIDNDLDKVYKIDISNSSSLGKFYGWPDYYGNAQPVTDPTFHSTRGKGPLQFVMLNHPPVEKPFTSIPQVGIGTTQVAITNGSNFGNISNNTAFMAQVGTATPITHSPKLIGPLTKITVGQKVILIDLKTGKETDFLSLKSPDPTFRPEGLKFNDKQGALYVVSFGKDEVRTKLPNGTPLPMPTPWAYAHTGVVWKIMKTGGSATANTTSTAGSTIEK